MKKMLVLAMCVALVASLTACGGLYSNAVNEMGAELEEMTEEEQEGEEAKEKLSIEEAVIYEGYGNIIKTTGEVTDGLNKVEIGLYVENNSAFNLDYSLDTFAVNGIMSDDFVTFLSSEIAAGKKGSLTIDISKSWLEENGIDEIQYIDIIFYGYDENSYNVELESDIVRIETNFFNGPVEFAEGTEIYSTDAMLVRLLSLNDDTMKFSVTNRSNEYFEITMKNLSVNDWAYDAGVEVYCTKVFPACTGIYEVEFDSDFKQQSSIESVTGVEFSLDVMPLGDFYNEYSTDVIYASPDEGE